MAPQSALIQRNFDAPLYAQIQRNIELDIATGRMQPGDLVSGEIELASQYGVSRATVRQALGELVADGLLYRAQGKGTFVASPMIQRAEPNITSFFYEMRQGGLKPTAQSSSEVCDPDAETVQALHLQRGEKVVITRRLRFVNDEPIGYQVNMTRYALCPGLENEDFSERSFQYTLEIMYNLRYAEVEESLTSVPANSRLAALLGVPEGAPLLLDARLLYTANNAIIGRSQAHFRGDRYIYKIVRRVCSSEE